MIIMISGVMSTLMLLHTLWYVGWNHIVCNNINVDLTPDIIIIVGVPSDLP
jgi:hypothetical protein